MQPLQPPWQHLAIPRVPAPGMFSRMRFVAILPNIFVNSRESKRLAELIMMGLSGTGSDPHFEVSMRKKWSSEHETNDRVASVSQSFKGRKDEEKKSAR